MKYYVLLSLLAPCMSSSLDGKGTISWEDARSQAQQLIANLTIEEKANFVTGTGWANGPCVGNLRAIPSIRFSGLCLQDSPTGVRFTANSSSFASSLNVAATFDRDLMYANGVAMGQEHRGKGVNVALAPMMNMLRAPAGGRNWEGQGGDPFLTSVSAALQVKGIQSTGVIATAKHFIGNEQEIHRHGISSEIDEKTLHEVYLRPFKACVDADVGAVMCSYNRVNGLYACENPHTLGLLKDTLGFKGFVMTDWNAAVDTTPTALAGSDVMMPGGDYFGPQLIDAVNKKEVSIDRLNDMVTRVLTPWIKFGQNKEGADAWPPVSFDSFTPSKSKPVNVQSDHAEHIRAVGAASAVLVKNHNNVLPLSANTVHTIAVIGEDARGPRTLNGCGDHGCIDGTVAQGWGSGTANFPYLVSPVDGITAQAKGKEIKVVSYLENDDVSAAASLAQSADVAIVFVMSNSGEEYITVEGNQGDRNNLSLWHNGDALVESVAKETKTIVVIHSPGSVDMPWINNPNVLGVVYALFPGQETGNAIADILFGAVNPSGRLPFTVASNVNDYPAAIKYDPLNAPGLDYPVLNYTEGLLLDYRWFDVHKELTPVFPFGHGLSYSTFQYSNLGIQNVNTLPPTISVQITNTGEYAGHEVAQLYLSFPQGHGQPVKMLKGFQKLMVSPNQRVTFSFPLVWDDVSVYDVDAKGWKVLDGQYTVLVGASSADIRLTGSFECKTNVCGNSGLVE